MRIGLVGGVFGEVRQSQIRRSTPETVLAAALRSRGHDVRTYSHYERVDTNLVDVVHVHHMSFGALAMAFDRSDVPFVYTHHVPFAHSRDASGFALPLSKRLAQRLVFSRADASIALSTTEAEYQESCFHLDGTRLHVIPNGQDAGMFRYGRRNAAGRDGTWRLLYVGQLNSNKRIDVLLRALAVLPSNVLLDLVYHIGQLEQDLRRLAASLGLDGRVRFVGPLAPPQLCDAYQRCDVFVLPSRAESLPTVLIEAMLCGTPVVATDVGGVRDELGPFGQVVPANRPDDLAQAIERVLGAYSSFSTQGRAMSEYAHSAFSVDSMADRHVELYARLADERAVRRHGHALDRAASRIGGSTVRMLTRRGISEWVRI